MDCNLSLTLDSTKVNDTNNVGSDSSDLQTISVSKEESVQELQSKSGQSSKEDTTLDINICNTSLVNDIKSNENIETVFKISDNIRDKSVNNSLVFEDKRNRTLRSRHLHEVKQLKSENQKLKNELNQLKRSKVRIEVKNKKLNQLIAENEILRNELSFSQNLNEILVKIKDYFEEKFKNLLSKNRLIESDSILNNLLKQYERVSIESHINHKYKSIVKEFNCQLKSSDNKTSSQSINAKRSRGRPPKQQILKHVITTDHSSLETTKSVSQMRPKRSKSCFTCEWPDCLYECSRNKMLTEHINSAHTGERPYICPMSGCVKSFSRSNTLDVHLKSCHSDVRPFKCNWEGCEAALKTKLGLSIHLQRHSGEKQFKCSWEGCAYSGMTKQRLDIHYMNHTGQRPFKCNWPGCDSNFTSSDCLRSHQKSHSNLRPFVCDWPGCDSAFKANRALSIHKVIHTNENLFKCNSCDFKCNRYHILASHRLNHTGGRKFLCNWPGCESKFDRRNKLELHLMIHRGDKPHKCPFNGCEKRFVEKGNMRKHYNSVHSKT